jgi:hypothetical protein
MEVAMRFSALCALVFCVGLTLAAAAGAVPPVHHTDSADYSGATSCGAFDDVYVGHLDVNVTSTFDKAGNPVTDIVHISGWETNSRSDMPSVTMTAHRSFTVIYTYATDSERDVGNIFTQTAPGEGVLFHDVGFIMFDGGSVTVHGPHDIFDQGDAAFCNALLAITP